MNQMTEKISYDRVCDFFNSENIETIAYSDKLNILMVRFTNATEYRYYDVPIEVWSSVVSAGSVGRAFNTYVSRSDFRYERIDI